MGLFEKENPIVCKLSYDNPDMVERVRDIILRTVQQTGGVPPDVFSNPLVRVHSWSNESDFKKRFVLQWNVDRLSQQTMDALEGLVCYFERPNLIQGRRDPVGKKRPHSKYTTMAGGKSERRMGYLLKEWGVQETGSTGLWVCRGFANRAKARRELRRNADWLYTGSALVELREEDGISQLDFAERVVQIARVLKCAQPLPYDQTLYGLYRDLSRIGLREKSEAEIAGLDELVDFIKWTLFAPSKNMQAAEYFHCRPESVLLAGVKGTGKTLIAEVLASQDHNSLFVPVSAVVLVGEKYESKGGSDKSESKNTLFSAVQELQKRTRARINLHCDDIEAALLSSENENGLATNSTLLNKLSGIRQSENMTLSGSTNDPYIIDDRFLRFGRIGYVLHAPLPDESARGAVLSIHTKGMPIATDVVLRDIAQRTEGYTPAALVEICNRAGLYALKGCAEELAKQQEITPFEALARMKSCEWTGRVVSLSDFERAFDLVAKYANPNGNMKADRQIKKFCDTYNKGEIGFGTR